MVNHIQSAFKTSCVRVTASLDTNFVYKESLQFCDEGLAEISWLATALCSDPYERTSK